MWKHFKAIMCSKGCSETTLKPLCARNGCSEPSRSDGKFELAMLSLPSHFWNLCVLALAVSGTQATSKPLCIPKIVSNLLCQLFGPDIIVSSTAKLLCVGCGCMLRWKTNELALDFCLLTIENINRRDTNPEKIMQFLTICNELLMRQNTY